MTNVSAELHALTIAAAARLIEKRQLSPVELTRTPLERIDALDGKVHAFITVPPGRALEQAKQAEAEIAAGRYRGPLHGIPIGIKDISVPFALALVWEPAQPGKGVRVFPL